MIIFGEKRGISGLLPLQNHTALPLTLKTASSRLLLINQILLLQKALILQELIFIIYIRLTIFPIYFHEAAISIFPLSTTISITLSSRHILLQMCTLILSTKLVLITHRSILIGFHKQDLVLQRNSESLADLGLSLEVLRLVLDVLVRLQAAVLRHIDLIDPIISCKHIISLLLLQRIPHLIRRKQGLLLLNAHSFMLFLE